MQPVVAQLNSIVEERTALLKIDFLFPVRPVLECPVTEMSFVRFREGCAYTDIERRTREIASVVSTRHIKGFRAHTWGTTPEQNGEAIYIGGWDSIEV